MTDDAIVAGVVLRWLSDRGYPVDAGHAVSLDWLNSRLAELVAAPTEVAEAGGSPSLFGMGWTGAVSAMMRIVADREAG